VGLQLVQVGVGVEDKNFSLKLIKNIKLNNLEVNKK
jgi:hypothetical protein